jgi:hypothetical protein
MALADLTPGIYLGSPGSGCNVFCHNSEGTRFANFEMQPSGFSCKRARLAPAIYARVK